MARRRVSLDNSGKQCESADDTATVVQPSSTVHLTSTHTGTAYSTTTVHASSNGPVPYTSFSSTGVYTIPATTIILTSTLVAPCPTASSSLTYAPGTYTRPETTMTITETNSVYVCPFTSATAASSQAAAPTPPSQAPSLAPAPAPAPTSEASAPAPASPTVDAPSYSIPTSSQSASPSSHSGSGSWPNSGNANPWCITYSPFSDDGRCKLEDTILTDISTIKEAGFSCVRIYGTDCKGLEYVGNACTVHNLKMVVGVFIDDKGIDAARTQVQQIIAWGRWGLVELIVIGNEALFNGYCTVGALVSFIVESKAQFQAAGYSGPCTTTETINVWERIDSSICSAIDVVGANLHPFFNSDVSPEEAGSFTARQMDLLRHVCPGMEVYNLECGWPQGGQANGKATPGVEHQRTAIKELEKWVGNRTVFFSAINEGWKKPGPLGVEDKFGCLEAFA